MTGLQSPLITNACFGKAVLFSMCNSENVINAIWDAFRSFRRFTNGILKHGYSSVACSCGRILEQPIEGKLRPIAVLLFWELRITYKSPRAALHPHRSIRGTSPRCL